MTAQDFYVDLVTGYAELLAAAGLGLTWRPAAPYVAGEIPIGLMEFPTGFDKAVALAPYPLAAAAGMTEDRVGLQVRCRSVSADPREVWRLDAAIGNVLLGLYPLTLSTGIKVVSMGDPSGASLGQDDKSRWHWASNYPLLVFRPTLHRV